MRLEYVFFHLNLKHKFGISGNTRTQTPVVYVKINYQGADGYGEASLPPYLGVTQEDVKIFLDKIDVSVLKNHWNNSEAQHCYLDSLQEGCSAAKAAVDIALFDLWGKLNNTPLYTAWKVNAGAMPTTAMTIGIDTPEIIRKKIEEAVDFKCLKIKLGSDNDKQIIETIRAVSNKPIYVDANQGWKSKEEALEIIFYLKEQGCVLIEQPLKKELLADTTWLSERSPLPLFADESFQRLADLDAVAGCFSGVNIKLMKCTGLFEARKIIEEAGKKNLKILMGCMNESSCAIMAAAQIAPLCDYVDLDGPWLINNNPFNTPLLHEGKITLSPNAGLGIGLIEPIFNR